MLRPILQYPDPRLARKSAEVAEIDDEIRTLAQDMLDTLKAVGGVGIAAPQIGVFRRVIILDLSQELKDRDAPQEFKALVNPRVTVLDPALHAENEGCALPLMRSTWTAAPFTSKARAITARPCSTKPTIWTANSSSIT